MKHLGFFFNFFYFPISINLRLKPASGSTTFHKANFTIYHVCQLLQTHYKKNTYLNNRINTIYVSRIFRDKTLYKCKKQSGPKQCINIIL